MRPFITGLISGSIIGVFLAVVEPSTTVAALFAYVLGSYSGALIESWHHA